MHLEGLGVFRQTSVVGGFWQMELYPNDREKTAFSLSGMGHFQFRVMPFSLTNAPSLFRRLTEEVLRGLFFKKCLYFIDDIHVFEKSFKSAWTVEF